MGPLTPRFLPLLVLTTMKDRSRLLRCDIKAELQHAWQCSAEIRAEAEQILRDATERSEVARKRVLVSMTADPPDSVV